MTRGILIFSCVFLGIGILFGQESVTRNTVLMGSSFSFTAVHEHVDSANMAVDAALAEVIRIEKLISSWDPESKTSEINVNAGIRPVVVPDELLQLIIRAKKIHTLSNGYFDISFASIDWIWDFSKDSITVPSSESLKASIAKINSENIIVDTTASTIFLKEKGMKIGFGSIGKGYAANKAKEIMLRYGVFSGVVNAGGDLTAWGEHPESKPWTVGVVNPLKKDEVAIWLDVNETAVVTSGNYEKFVEINGEKYCHIIDPKTGWPGKGVSSVTVVCKDAEFADALATTIFLLGVNDGMKLINHLKGVEGILIDEVGNVFYSENLRMHEKK